MRNGKRLDLVHEKALAVLRRGGARSATKHVEGESTFDNVNNDKRRLQENYLIWLGGIPFEFVDETSIFPWGVDVYYG